MSLTFNLSDHIPEPSATVEELNEELTKMRKVVRAAKVHVSRDLISYVKKLRVKTSHLEGCRRLENKIKNRVSDIKLLNSLSVVRLCKRLLAEGMNEDVLQKSGSRLSQEDRLILRLKSSKPVTDFVKSFRENHEDWMSLSREQKRRNKKVRGSLPLPPAPVQETEINVLQDESSLSVYRVENESEQSKSYTKPLTVTNSLSGNDIFRDVDYNAAETMITQLLERKGIQKNSFFDSPVSSSAEEVNSSIDRLCSMDQSTERKMSKPKVSNSSNSLNVNEKRSESFSSYENPSSNKRLVEDPLSEELDDPLGNDDREVRKLFRNKNFKNRSEPVKKFQVNSRLVPKKQNSTRFPNKLKPQSLQMHKIAPTVSETLISELDKPNIHPSWEARRTDKAKIIDVLKGPAPEVKRIVFDD
ncbi:unnamed protein product [Heterobilharzia americana]|nr:unnamed protein product [Heterobilharzia americana]